MLLSILAGGIASRLTVDSDLRRLLPQDHPVVQSLHRIEETFGSTGSVNLVVKGGTAEARHAFTDAVAEKLEGHPLLDSVDYRLPSTFFAQHALYYLTDAEMEELDERIQAWMHYEFCTKAPEQCISDPDPKAPEQLEAFVEAKRNQAHERTGFRDRYERDGIEAAVMLLHPVQSAASLDFAKEVTRAMRAELAEVYARPDAPWAGSGMTYNIVGPYVTKADEHETIRKDTFWASVFATAGLLTVLYLLFRSWRAIFVLLLPLACGVSWTMAVTQLVLGHLNLMTSLIASVVMGSGIDAGIHFFVRARREREQHDDEQAVVRAFRGVIVPLLVASSTTVGAFLTMASSDFPAFHEFGIIGACGIALCLLAMTTVLPAFTYLVGIKNVSHPPRMRGLMTRIVMGRPGTVLGLVALVTALASLGVRQVEFEYNGRALQSDYARDHTEADTHLISKIFGKDIHAGILVRDDLAQTRKTLQHARREHEARRAEGRSVVAALFAAPDLLPDPSIDLEARKEAIDVLLEEDTIDELREIAEGRGDGPERKLTAEDARLLLDMLEAQPFTIEDLPPVLLDKVRSPDGAYGIFAHPDFDAADMRKGVEFMVETAAYLEPGDEGRFVGETTVYAAMFLMLQDEAPVVLGVAALLIAVLVYWQVRSVRHAAMTLLPLVLALWWLLGVMGALDIRFTLFNLPILPVVLGIGVDNGVYLTDRIFRNRTEAAALARSVQETGAAILAATTTTAIGFAAFMVADSAGVRGIGLVALVGILLAAVAATLVLPAIAGLVQRRRP